VAVVVAAEAGAIGRAVFDGFPEKIIAAAVTTPLRTVLWAVFNVFPLALGAVLIPTTTRAVKNACFTGLSYFKIAGPITAISAAAILRAALAIFSTIPTAVAVAAQFGAIFGTIV
jgi:hypothetical protein